MRLGKHPCIFQPGSEWSKLRALYGSAPQIQERHRHRYEVNPEMVDRLEKAGLTFVGKDVKGERMEIIELKDHPWFVGVQFHPEYLSRVLAPSFVCPSFPLCQYIRLTGFFLDCSRLLRRRRWMPGRNHGEA